MTVTVYDLPKQDLRSNLTVWVELPCMRNIYPNGL